MHSILSFKSISHYLLGGQRVRFRVVSETGFSNMPTLNEICVWELPFPPDDLELETTGSPNVYFTTDCN